MTRPPHILLVEAPYYPHIADRLRQGAEGALTAARATHERISVPGAFEIPAAIGLVARASERFDGFVALGCVIRGETTHYDHICSESARGLDRMACAARRRQTRGTSQHRRPGEGRDPSFSLSVAGG